MSSDPNNYHDLIPVVYPACVVTCAESRKAGVVDLSDTIMAETLEMAKLGLMDTFEEKLESTSGKSVEWAICFT